MSDAYAAAWLSEMWPVVREYQGFSQKPVVAPKRSAPREPCPICGGRFVADRLVDHVLSAHPESVVESGKGAA